MLDDDACYVAVQTRDPLHDGLFFTAVKTTRIYCRPICPARTPLRRNVAFYESAAQAQEAGYRPCLRCRPESAPDSPAWVGSLASVNRALRLIDEGALVEAGVETLAGKLGLTGRHLRRLFVRHLGVAPLQIEQTRRIHLAKTLLHDSELSMTEVAFAAGFGSLRRFNEAFLTLFGRPPGAIRKDTVRDRTADDSRRLQPAGRGAAALSLRLHHRPPFDWATWLADRARMETGNGVVDTGEFRTVLPPEQGGGRVTLVQGPGRTIVMTVEDVPIRHLARVIANAKRDLTLGIPLSEAEA